MPSDPSGVKPSGVLARAAPDFFDDNLYVGAGTVPTTASATAFWASISLYNNANTGQLFKVYAVTVNNVFAGGFAAFFIKGQVGTKFAACQSIRADLGGQYGIINTQGQALAGGDTSNPFITTTPAAILGTSGESFTIVSPFPLFIVPVGYSLVVANLVEAQAPDNSLVRAGASFWYQLANE